MPEVKLNEAEAVKSRNFSAAINQQPFEILPQNFACFHFLHMPTYGEKISQIQIGGLQPCDDLTWNDPGSELGSAVLQLD